MQNETDKPRAEWWDRLPKGCVSLMLCHLSKLCQRCSHALTHTRRASCHEPCEGACLPPRRIQSPGGLEILMGRIADRIIDALVSLAPLLIFAGGVAVGLCVGANLEKFF